RVLVSAVATEDFRAVADFVGEQLFFVARLDATGLGSVKQLPFFVVHDREVGDPSVDGEKAVVRMPPKSWMTRLRAFDLGNQQLVVFASLEWPDDQGEDLQKLPAWNTSQILVIGSVAGVSVVNHRDFRKGASALAPQGLWLAPFSLLLGSPRQGALLFSGKCTSGQDRSKVLAFCPWMLSIVP
ncbi:MAG: hypothetical protein ACP5NF_11995, partial [Thermoanaerobaculum sp.]